MHPMRYLLTNIFDCMPHKFYFILDTISMQELQLEVIGCQNEMLPLPLLKQGNDFKSNLSIENVILYYHDIEINIEE